MNHVSLYSRSSGMDNHELDTYKNCHKSITERFFKKPFLFSALYNFKSVDSSIKVPMLLVVQKWHTHREWLTLLLYIRGWGLIRTRETQTQIHSVSPRSASVVHNIWSTVRVVNQCFLRWGRRLKSGGSAMVPHFGGNTGYM